MRPHFSQLAAVMLLLAGSLLAADPALRPVSVQELSLLLRSGYTGDEMLRETAGRPLLTPIDAAAERALLDAGADARTVAALRASHPVATQNEAAEVQRRQAAAEKYRLESWEADQARRADEGRQAVNTKLATRREDALKQVGTLLRDKLVVYQHGRLEPYDNAALAGKRIFLLYVAAGSDKNSRKLTPPLVEFYKKFASAHPEFELVLIPGDRTAADLEQFMKNEQMPWPALAFEQLAQQPDLAALGKQGFPRFVLIDGSGQQLADNLENGKLTDPKRVLDTLLSRTDPKQAAR